MQINTQEDETHDNFLIWLSILFGIHIRKAPYFPVAYAQTFFHYTNLERPGEL